MIREAWILSIFLCARTKLTMWAGNSQFTMLSKSEQKYAWMKRFCHCSWPRSDPSPCLASFVTPQSPSTKFRGDENLTWKQIDLFCNIILGPLSGATNCRTLYWSQQVYMLKSMSIHLHIHDKFYYKIIFWPLIFIWLEALDIGKCLTTYYQSKLNHNFTFYAPIS